MVGGRGAGRSGTGKVPTAHCTVGLGMLVAAFSGSSGCCRKATHCHPRRAVTPRKACAFVAHLTQATAEVLGTLPFLPYYLKVPY